MNYQRQVRDWGKETARIKRFRKQKIYEGRKRQNQLQAMLSKSGERPEPVTVSLKPKMNNKKIIFKDLFKSFKKVG